MLLLDCILICKLHFCRIREMLSAGQQVLSALGNYKNSRQTSFIQRSLNLACHNPCSSISVIKIKMNIVQIFPAAYAKSLLDSDLTMKRKLLEMKQFPGKHTVWILLLCAFQTGPKPVPACCTQTPGAVTRSGFLPSCQACTTVWMNNARSCLEPMPLSAMTWRYNIQLF